MSICKNYHQKMFQLLLFKLKKTIFALAYEIEFILKNHLRGMLKQFIVLKH